MAELSRTALNRIAVTGWCLAAGWAGTLVAWAMVDPDPYAQGWRLVLELAFVGRLVSVADGIASGFSQTYLLIQSGVQDVILLLVVYPVVVTAYQGSSRTGWLGGVIGRVRRTAEEHRRIVEPLGVVGLWAFVFFPFWSTGALVGGVVGYMIGLRTSAVFASVFSGHLVSVVSLVWFFESMREVMESIDQSLVRFLPWFVLVVLLLSVLARLIRRFRTDEG